MQNDMSLNISSFKITHIKTARFKISDILHPEKEVCLFFYRWPLALTTDLQPNH